MAKILERINGHCYPIATIGLVLTAIGIGVAILIVALDTREEIGMIKEQSRNNAVNITMTELRFNDRISYLDIYGCKTSQNNAKSLAVIGAK